MDIAHIGGKGISEVAGTKDDYIVQQTTHLAHLGHRLFLYCLEEQKTDLYNGLHLIHFRSPFKGWLHQIIHSTVAAWHAALFIRADIIHLHSYFAGFAVPWIRIFRPSAIIFLTLHETENNKVKNSFVRMLLGLGERITLTRAAHVFVTKQNIVNDLLLRKNIRAEFMPPGVSVKRVAINDIVLKPFNLKSYHYLLMVAPHDTESGVFTLLDAWQKARAERPDLFQDLKLALVSSEKENKLDLTEYLSDSVVFVGFQNREVLAALYAGARFVVAPASYTKNPAEILTALSYGKAVVAASLGEYSVLLQDETLLFEPGNADELAWCLLQLCADETLTASLGHSARSFVEEEYCWEILSREVEDEYKKHRALREGLLVAE